MALTIPFKYDILQIIASFKKDQPKLWQALNDLNTSGRDLNQLTGNLKALGLYERITFHIPVGSFGTELGRYLVQMPCDENNNPICTQLNLTKLVLSSEVIPAADDVADIEISNDRGVSWRSILKLTGTDPAVVYDKATLVLGQTLMSYGSPQFATSTLKHNDMLRFDFISGDSADNIEVDLIGNYQL